MNYYFAHFCHEENKWILNKQRFLLSPGNILLGQYITSNWFNWPMHQEKDMKFLVIGLHTSIKKKRHPIIDTLNQNVNPFGIGQGNKEIFIEIFEYSRNETEKLVEEKVDKNIILSGGKNTNNKLVIRMIYHNKLLLATLPQFELETGSSYV